MGRWRARALNTDWLRWLGLGLALAGFLWYVWPTPWSYYTVRGRHAETEHYRVNRFTGDTEVLTRQGWK